MATRCAVIDIGSNSIKCLIAEKVGKHLRVIEEASLPTRLAEGLIRTGRLQPEAMERTLKVLQDLKEKVEGFAVEELRAVATSAVRDSTNRKRFLKQAREVLGAPVQLLSGEQEAQKVFLAVSLDPFFQSQRLVTIEIGGGSVQWAQGKGRHIEASVSLPLGAVRLRERFIQAHPVTVRCVKEIQARLEGQLAPVLSRFGSPLGLLVGTGGTITSLAAIVQKLVVFDPEAVDHFVVTRQVLKERLQELAQLTLAELEEVLGLPSKRTDLIIPGACVLHVTMKLLKARALTVSTRGLRYALLQEWVREEAG